MIPVVSFSVWIATTASAGPSSSRDTGQPGPGDIDGGPRETRPRVAQPQPETDPQWWRGAVIYQVYPRSFADGNGDGTGDLAGLRARLPYLRDLGVDAIWVTPWYVSPLADGGYDVADYRAIDPAFGTLEEAEALIAEALRAGHPDDHRRRPEPRLRPARVVPGGARRRAGLAGARPVLVPPRQGRARRRRSRRSWVSDFQGSTWTRTTDPDGTPGEWYLHLFAPQQPDLNWSHPDVVAEFEDVLRFWFDRGVAGIRIDSAALLVKDPALPEVPGRTPDRASTRTSTATSCTTSTAAGGPSPTPTRARASSSARSGCQDTGAVRAVPAPRRDAHRVQLRLHGAARGTPSSCASRSTSTLAAHGPVGAPATWVLSNHDVTRPVTRYGREDTSFAFTAKRFGTPTDLAVGLRRARAAALLTAALPGSLYIYQGDELGLPEVEDLPLDAAAGPDALPLRGRRPRPGRLPRAAALVRDRPPRSGSARRRDRGAVAPAARRLGGADRRGAGGRPRVHAAPVPRPPARSAGPSPPWATGR